MEKRKNQPMYHRHVKKVRNNNNCSILRIRNKKVKMDEFNCAPKLLSKYSKNNFYVFFFLTKYKKKNSVNPATVPPIPTKRPKVITNKKFLSTDNQTDIKELSHETGINNPMKSVNFKKDDGLSSPALNAGIVITCDETIQSNASNLELNRNAAAITFDPNIPCCSYQLPPQSSSATASAASSSSSSATSSLNTFKYPNVVNKTGTFARKPITTNPTSTLSAIKLRSGFSNATVETRSFRKSSLAKDGRRMKKKKSLKADTGLKRKKSKVF